MSTSLTNSPEAASGTAAAVVPPTGDIMPVTDPALEAMRVPPLVADVPASQPEPSSPAAVPPEDDGGAETAALERLAAETGCLPVVLLRKACSIPAEKLLRQLGRLARGSEPWLPVGSVGPVLIFAHHRAGDEDFWGVPEFLRISVVVSEESYRAVLGDLAERLRFKPIAQDSPHEGRIPAPPAESDAKGVLDWFAESYPMPDAERTKMRRLVQENASKPMETIENLSFLPRHYGAAVMYWMTGESCYNPEEAPGQDMFPDTLLEKHSVFPLYCGVNRVHLLSARRSNYAFEDEWLSMGHDAIEIVCVTADPAAIDQAISRNRGRGNRESGQKIDVGDLYFSENTNLIDVDPLEMSRINPANPNNTPEQVMHWIFNRAISLRSSDLHIEKYYNTVRFRARIDGQLHTVHSASEEELPRFIALIKNWSNLPQERQTLQDARMAMKIGKRRIDVRVSAVPCRKEQQKVTMRFLDKQDGIKTLTELNLSERQSKIVKDTMSRDQGLVLVTGPTGSGKTTTLYAFLNSINDESINIHTIEDPIEYEIEGINQTQTDPFNGIDFANGLRALLRADPDVMLIGESRDQETATAAINSALTGHLVLTTLHANDSLRAVSRLLSMGIAPYLLADALAMSQAQRLVRRLCPYCKHPAPMTPKIQDFLHKQGVLEQVGDEPIYEKVGCDECHGTGFSGRIALMEMLQVGPDLSDLIATGAPVSEMRKIAESQGVLTLYQEGLRQAVAGLTTFDEIKGVAYTGAAE